MLLSIHPELKDFQMPTSAPAPVAQDSGWSTPAAPANTDIQMNATEDVNAGF